MNSKKTPSKILITRLSAHGDVIQTLPLLAALKNEGENVLISWVVEESAAPLLLNHPLIHRLHISRRKTWIKTLLKKPWHFFNVFSQLLAFFDDIKKEQYDLSIDVQGLLKSALIPFLAGIPRRLGYKDTREQAHRFYTEHLPKHELSNPNIPTVLKFREFAKALGYLNENTLETFKSTDYPLPPIAEPSKEKIQSLLLPLLTSSHLTSFHSQGPIIALAPKTIWPSKHWPQAHWKTLLNTLSHWPVHLLVLGAPDEKAGVQALLSGLETAPNIHNWCGQTELSDCYELFQHVSLFIGLDSALLHMANAVSFNHPNQTPRIIGLYGPTGPNRTGPINLPEHSNLSEPLPQHQTLFKALSCQPCFKRICPLDDEASNQCMSQLSVEDVLQAITGVLNQAKSLTAEEVTER